MCKEGSIYAPQDMCKEGAIYAPQHKCKTEGSLSVAPQVNPSYVHPQLALKRKVKQYRKKNLPVPREVFEQLSVAAQTALYSANP